MYCLGIESTAHTFGVGVVDGKGNVLANVKSSYVTEKGGINPSEAKEHHENVKDKIVEEVFQEAGLNVSEVGLIAFSQGPGLPPCLAVGKNKAVELAKSNKIPIVGVNHCIAHLEIGKLKTDAKDPVLLYASGANTQIIGFENNKYRVFGETLDNGVGNFIDGFARHVGLGFPGGPKIEKLALKSKKYIELPYVVKGMDVSFGGIQTNLKHKFDANNFSLKDLSYSLQETAFAMLVEVSERALAHTGKKELVLGGGVGCNKRLQEMCKVMCEERGAKFFVPENEYLVDNGAMVAWSGVLMESKWKKDYEIDINPIERTDDVEVDWI
tara:strand:- start:21009 stop:21986 length:978 start_codon:yes stop_codon:yes gene_type:complete